MVIYYFASYDRRVGRISSHLRRQFRVHRILFHHVLIDGMPRHGDLQLHGDQFVAHALRRLLDVDQRRAIGHGRAALLHLGAHRGVIVVRAQRLLFEVGFGTIDVGVGGAQFGQFDGDGFVLGQQWGQIGVQVEFARGDLLGGQLDVGAQALQLGERVDGDLVWGLYNKKEHKYMFCYIIR